MIFSNWISIYMYLLYIYVRILIWIEYFEWKECFDEYCNNNDIKGINNEGRKG